MRAFTSLCLSRPCTRCTSCSAFFVGRPALPGPTGYLLWFVISGTMFGSQGSRPGGQNGGLFPGSAPSGFGGPRPSFSMGAKLDTKTKKPLVTPLPAAGQSTSAQSGVVTAVVPGSTPGPLRCNEESATAPLSLPKAAVSGVPALPEPDSKKLKPASPGSHPVPVVDLGPVVQAVAGLQRSVDVVAQGLEGLKPLMRCAAALELIASRLEKFPPLSEAVQSLQPLVGVTRDVGGSIADVVSALDKLGGGNAGLLAKPGPERGRDGRGSYPFEEGLSFPVKPRSRQDTDDEGLQESRSRRPVRTHSDGGDSERHRRHRDAQRKKEDKAPRSLFAKKGR